MSLQIIYLFIYLEREIERFFFKVLYYILSTFASKNIIKDIEHIMKLLLFNIRH